MLRGPRFDLDALRPDPTAIGDVSAPTFAIVPDPRSIFSDRAQRLRTYGGVSPMKLYLDFVADIAQAQSETVLSQGWAPTDVMAARRASTFGMPPIDRVKLAADATIISTLHQFLDRLEHFVMPVAAVTALHRVRHATKVETQAWQRSVLEGGSLVDELAEHALVAAGLQVHLATLAAGLDPSALSPVGDGVCPACGGAPVASIIVDRANAHGNRYCVCSMCATQWNFVRIRCCSCGSTKGVGYQEIEGASGAIKAETCDECGTYVKVMYENLDTTIEAAADDIGTLALDLLMKDGPYRRAAYNPFLFRF